ncbi:MAG: hypothetical protein ACR2J8_01795 [Thermomicrobiales bacterium]
MTSTKPRLWRTITVALIAGMLIGGLAMNAASKGKQNPARWSWLVGTTWIVPKTNLPAIAFDANTQIISSATDQTVYQITGYRDGYFWGPTAATFDGGAVGCKSMIGSVTPQGSVYLSFSQTINGKTSITQGWGVMLKRGGKWTMQNQTGTTSMAHWAYMVQSQPGDATWNSLPGVGVSVDDFMANCPAGPQPAS